MFHYWWRVSGHALSETFGWISKHWQASTMAFATAIVAGAFYHVAAHDNWQEKFIEGLIIPLAGSIILSLMFLVIFGWKMFQIPDRWDREKSAHIADLSMQLKKLRARPKIDIYFDGSDRYFQRTFFDNDRDNQVVFVSVRAIAAPLGAYIRECRGYVDAVWKIAPDGRLLPTALNEAQILEWSSQGTGGSAKTGLDAERGRLLNVFRIQKRHPVIVPCIPNPLNRHADVFNEKRAIYRLDIRVSSYGEAEPGYISLKVQLGERWDDVKVERIQVKDEPRLYSQVMQTGLVCAGNRAEP